MVTARPVERADATTPQPPTDRWIAASRDDYDRAIATSENAKGYYYRGSMRLEMSPVGNLHSRDHFILSTAIGLFAALRGIKLDGQDNCSYRKTGVGEAQPDLSFYGSDRAGSVPWEMTVVDLDRVGAPDLVVEVSHSTLSDDRGTKRMLYEDLGVSEYWIVDVAAAAIACFAMLEGGGSRRVRESVVLPGLTLDVLEAALQQSRGSDHGQVSAWLLTQWQNNP